ncbi:MAG: glycoside hydrolase family 99-like domain-containing protein [Armatimonadota bacterium]
MKYQVGVYYFPNYHVDPRNEAVHGTGWTEWELTKRAEPRFEGHHPPPQPMWGYEDESDPAVFAKKIDAAADNSINHFIFDWYWYNDGPFLNRCLDHGYMNAANNDRLKFALMWANHDWSDIHPAKYRQDPRVLHSGDVTPETFRSMTDYVIDFYFKHPGYWKIDECPYFSIYDLMAFIKGMGGMEEARNELRSFREKTKAAGFPDLHLNAVVWGIRILANEQKIEDPNTVLDYLGFDSISSYVWVHHVPLSSFPVMHYADVAEKAEEYWHEAIESFRLPYQPNVSMGWDSSPRTCQSDAFENVGYPFTPVIDGNTPEAFKESLRHAKEFLDNHAGHGIMNINAWNEWTEGSYLEPDMVHGMGYLEAIGEVFSE